MSLTIEKLIKDGYTGFSVRSILMNPEFRERVIRDVSVRGNITGKNLVMDKLAVGGKVLLTGPTGEAKTLFARILLDHVVREINNFKYHIEGCPFLEDAGYIKDVIDNYASNPFAGIRVMQSLCPYCRTNIEKTLSKDGASVQLDNTNSMLEIPPKEVVSRLGKLGAVKTLVRRSQLDPRTDPESLYMLLAGVENLEELFGKDTSTTYAATSHKVGVLSHGFIVVNEIQRLPLTLLESLMGFLEEPMGIKYNIQGEPVYIDGAVLFTSNAPLTVFGEESQPIINRIPEVLWPARSVESREQIIRDMFEEQIVLSRKSITANPSIIQLHELEKETTDFVSRLAVDFLAYIGNNSLPETLKTKGLRSESRMERNDFYSGLDEIHDPQRNPHIDLRTMNNIIGETVLLQAREAEAEVNVITLEKLRDTMSAYDIPVSMVNDALQQMKIMLRTSIKESEVSISVQDISEDISKMKALSDDELADLVVKFEGLDKYKENIRTTIIEKLKPSYEQLLKVDYI
jgi:MoxR-like ATPase